MKTFSRTHNSCSSRCDGFSGSRQNSVNFRRLSPNAYENANSSNMNKMYASQDDLHQSQSSSVFYRQCSVYEPDSVHMRHPNTTNAATEVDFARVADSDHNEQTSSGHESQYAFCFFQFIFDQFFRF